MFYRIDHETKLTYTGPVTDSVIELRMTPPSTSEQTLMGHRVRLVPSVLTTGYADGFGNRVTIFNMGAPMQELTIMASSCVQLHQRTYDALLDAIPWPNPDLRDEVGAEFIRPSQLAQPCPELEQFLAQLPKSMTTLQQVSEAITELIHQEIEYVKEATTSNTSMAEALRLKKGVCQDFTHIFLGAARSLGIPARYVSGYINQPGEIATHAWCQLWCGQATGWVDVDPTHRELNKYEHILTATGRDFMDVPPNRGVWRGADVEEKISVQVTVQQVDRLPPDLTDATAPVTWSQPQIVQNNLSPQFERMLLQQFRREIVRQQQSQQQQ
ncbi:MAG: transglutaminase family protein [Zavarzinella sp.]